MISPKNRPGHWGFRKFSDRLHVTKLRSSAVEWDNCFQVPCPSVFRIIPNPAQLFSYFISESKALTQRHSKGSRKYHFFSLKKLKSFLQGINLNLRQLVWFLLSFGKRGNASFKKKMQFLFLKIQVYFPPASLLQRIWSKVYFITQFSEKWTGPEKLPSESSKSDLAFCPWNPSPSFHSWTEVNFKLFWEFRASYSDSHWPYDSLPHSLSLKPDPLVLQFPAW